MSRMITREELGRGGGWRGRERERKKKKKKKKDKEFSWEPFGMMPLGKMEM